MERKYFYNLNTHRLHIFGYCRESNSVPFNTKYFATYDDALAYDGRAVGLCKNCQRKENRMKEA